MDGVVAPWLVRLIVLGGGRGLGGLGGGGSLQQQTDESAGSLVDLDQ